MDEGTYWHFDEVIDGVGQLATHGKVFDQLGTMLALLPGCLEEVFGESGTVDGVSGEVCGHGQVCGGGEDLLLNLVTHSLDASIVHVRPAVENRVRLDVACNGGKGVEKCYKRIQCKDYSFNLCI